MSKPRKYLTVSLWIVAVIGMMATLAMKMLPAGRGAMSASPAAAAAPAIALPEPLATAADQLPAVGSVPAFSLIDQAGKPATRDRFAGQVWICDFIFTTCASICPQMTAHMHALQEKLPAGVKLVSFSVDPAHDTPEVLTKYASDYHADTNRWTFLTGSVSDMSNVVRDFKLFFQPAIGDQSLQHDSHFVLVDGSGQVRGYYDSNFPDSMDRLANDANLLLRAAGGQ